MLSSTKHILSITVLLILVSTELNCLTITTDGCGTEKGCFMFPPSCTNNCDFLVTYNVTSSNMVEFELSGKGDWVAVGFSDDRLMANTDILMCVSNGNLSGHYYATGRTTPAMTTPTPAAVNVTEQANDGGMMKCRISRDINPSPAIQNFRNLSEEVYLLGAIGSLSGVTIQQHSARQSSNSKINVTHVEDPTTTAPTTMAPTTTAPAQGSFRIPDSCSSSDDCDFLVTYQRIGDTVEFELSGRAGWAGVGFSDDQNMADTDLLMCVSDQSESGHYYAENRIRPDMTTPTPGAVRIVEHSNAGGVVKCKISREINPGITNFRDLSQPWFLLGAIGNYDGAIQQHSRRQPTASRITVTEEQPTITAPTTTAPTTTAPAQGSFRIPDSCSSSDDCDFLVTYQRIGETVEFELSGRAGWAGVGFSDDQNMADTDLLMCVSDQSESGHYYADDRTRPDMTTPTPSEVRIVEHSNDGGVVRCRISRDIISLDPGIPNFRDLSQPWFLLGAIGNFDGVIQQHSIRQATASRVTVTEAGSASPAGLNTNIIAHGTLMTLAWILFAAVGMFTARYMRVVWEPKQLLGTKAWFTVHRTVMTITVLLTVAGINVIFIHVDGWSSGAGAHPYFGIVVLAFALAQPIMALFRPHPGEPRRNIFNWAHRIVGTLALILGAVTVYLGTDLVGLGKNGLYAVITFFIAVFFVFVFELCLIMYKQNQKKRPVPVGITNADIPMEQPGHQTPAWSELKMPFKERMIRTFMFVFVVLVGASVSLTIILLMALK